METNEQMLRRFAHTFEDAEINGDTITYFKRRQLPNGRIEEYDREVVPYEDRKEAIERRFYE